MKKTVLFVSFMCLILLLTGCDLFGKTTLESTTSSDATTSHRVTTVTPLITSESTTQSTTTQSTTTQSTTTQSTTTESSTTQTTEAIRTISFVSNGGTQIEPISQLESTHVDEPTNPVKEGYLFSGWYTSMESIDPYEFDTMPSNNLVLYADWATEGLVYTLINEDLEYEVSIQDAEDIVSIQIPKYHEGKPVTRIAEYGFASCYNLTEFIYPATITSIGAYAFLDCQELTQFDISEHITDIDSALFKGCSSLEAITVDTNNLDYVSIDGVLFDITESLLITYPSSKAGTSYTINDHVQSIEPYAFNTAMNLTTITIGNHVTIIKTHAFFDCWSLTSIVIPDQVTTIELYAFRNCVGLVDVTIGSGLTGIDAYVFNRCISLESITIPSNIEYIGYGAFYDCMNLSLIIIDKTRAEGVITGGLFMFTNTKSNLLIYVPDLDTKNEYILESMWSSYASKIVVNPN